MRYYRDIISISAGVCYIPDQCVSVYGVCSTWLGGPAEMDTGCGGGGGGGGGGGEFEMKFIDN